MKQGSAAEVTPHISVIVPVWNAETWLRPCLESILAQTFTDFELIVVDDGSPDGAGAIADSIAAADPRVRVIHTENHGVSAARNIGIDAANGRWLAFVDADDWVAPGLFEALVADAEATGAQIVSCDMLMTEADSQVQAHRVNRAPQVMAADEAVRTALLQRRGPNCSPCAKIYARELWEEMRFTPGLKYEDLDIFYRLWLRANKVSWRRDRLYFYRRHGGSFLAIYSPARLDVLDVTARLEKYMAENRPDLLAAARDRSLSAAFNMMMLNRRRGTPDVAVRDRCRAIVRERRYESLTGKGVRPKNRLGALMSYLVF